MRKFSWRGVSDCKCKQIGYRHPTHFEKFWGQSTPFDQRVIGRRRLGSGIVIVIFGRTGVRVPTFVGMGGRLRALVGIISRRVSVGGKIGMGDKNLVMVDIAFHIFLVIGPKIPSLKQHPHSTWATLNGEFTFS